MADKRVALVIGNSAYKHAPTLSNPVNDATLVGGMLEKAGFDSVDIRLDLGARDMRAALRDFAAKTHDADKAVIYYAGHGIELDGNNYLIPADAMLETDGDVLDEAIPLDRALFAVEPAKQLRLVILDACRDNPFAKTMKRTMASRGIGRGLAKVEPTSPNTMIAFAAKAGSTASDGDSRNSPFAVALVKHLPKPGLDLRRAFGFVRDDVLKSTGFKQEPYVYGSLGGDDVPLVPSTSAGASQPGTPDAVRRDYELALQIGTREVWTAFLAQYPEGFYASLAKGQLARIAANDGRAGSTSDVGKSEQDKTGTAADRTDPGSVEKPPITKSAEAPSVARPVAEAKPTAREEPKKDEPAPKERVASLPPAQTSVTPKPSCRSGQLPNTRGECEAPRRAEPAYRKKEQGVASRTELSEPREPRGGRCTSISQRCAMEIGGRCDPATGKWEYGRNGAGGNTLAFNTCIGRMMAGNKR